MTTQQLEAFRAARFVLEQGKDLWPPAVAGKLKSTIAAVDRVENVILRGDNETSLQDSIKAVRKALLAAKIACSAEADSNCIAVLAEAERQLQSVGVDSTKL